jgi:signal transduction histidine kinase
MLAKRFALMRDWEAFRIDARLGSILQFAPLIAVAIRSNDGPNKDPQNEDESVKQARTAALEELPEAIGFIRSSTRKMDTLINAILKLSREGRRVLKPEAIRLDALLKSAAASVQHQVTDAGGAVPRSNKSSVIYLITPLNTLA